MISRSLGHRAPLLWLVLPFISGLGLGKLTGCRSAIWPLLAALAAAVVAMVFARTMTRRWHVGLVIAMTLAGVGSYALHRARLPTWDLLPSREARLALKVTRVFIQADPKRATGLATVTRAGEHLGDLVGQTIYFSLTLRKGESAPLRSTTLSVVGVLVTLPAIRPPSRSRAILLEPA